MTLREMTEQQELQLLSPYAMKAIESKGRVKEETPCEFRTCFQQDRDRILHSKAFRRLAHKTQVFILPQRDHYRNRLTHSLEVSQVGRAIARGLGLNEDLVEAAGIGHDLGHTPLGHAGERALSTMTNGYFKHNMQSARVVSQIENNKKGINLSWEVVDAITNHRTACTPHTLEGKVVQFADKIAYINHDIDDVIRAGILVEDELPKECTRILGHSQSERINTLIASIIKESKGKNYVALEPEVNKAYTELRRFMFEQIYENPLVKTEDLKAEHMIMALYEAYAKNVNLMPDKYIKKLEEQSKEIVICDYISCMTDRFALDEYQKLYVPSGWQS